MGQTHYYRRKAAGLCIKCKNPPVPGRTRCEKHLRAAYRFYIMKKWGSCIPTEDMVCAICGLKEPRKDRKTLSVDHEHRTRLIRGYLCTNCNFGLGHFKDNPSLLQHAKEYLLGSV